MLNEALLAAEKQDKKAIKECRAKNRRVQFQVTTINNKPLDPPEEEK